MLPLSSNVLLELKMRFPTIKTDFWELRSAEASHLKNPESFWIPLLDERQNIQRGQLARLIFDIEVENEAGAPEIVGERMWVMVSEALPDGFIGLLDNQPACCDVDSNFYLSFGAEIPFQVGDIIDIMNPEQEHADWHLSQTPERAWPRD